jgi:hypothetical protein
MWSSTKKPPRDRRREFGGPPTPVGSRRLCRFDSVLRCGLGPQGFPINGTPTPGGWLELSDRRGDEARRPGPQHLDWLYPLFNECLETSDGRMLLSGRPGLGVTLTEQARAWTVDRVHIDAPR